MNKHEQTARLVLHPVLHPLRSTASLDEHQITMRDKGHGDGGVTELLHQLAADRLEEPDVKEDMTVMTVCENCERTAANSLTN